MSTLHPFPALRPPRELAARVSSLPYDVMNHREAKEMAAGNDASFLHICRSDIDTSEAAIHAPETYAKARENLERFVREGYLFRDERPSFYIYRQIMWGRVQTGIVGCASVDEYASGAIKKHELTRREKELDRIEHFDACSAQTEPVFLAYRKHEGLSAIIREWIKFHKPEYDLPRRTASPISCGPFPSPARWKTSAKALRKWTPFTLRTDTTARLPAPPFPPGAARNTRTTRGRKNSTT